MGGTRCGWDPGWALTIKSSSVGSESAPNFNMSLWSWVRALTEAKEKARGLGLILL